MLIPYNLVEAVIALFVVVDPLGNMPIFLSLTSDIGEDERKRMFNVATAVGFIVLMVFAVIGKGFLDALGISLYSFMVAGGLLLMIISVKIIIQGGWREEALSPSDLGVIPIAFPLLVGPGAITTTIVTLQSNGVTTALASVAIVFAIVWVMLRFIKYINKILGRIGSMVVARVTAIMIAALGVQFVIQGLKGAVTHF
ncbi:MAG: MarC family protein [Candidatus Bathyarchaeia archaeon]